MASANTLTAYRADWAHFTRWCRLKGLPPLPANAEAIGLYLSDLAAPPDASRPLTASTIERRFAGLVWNYGQRGFTLDRQDPPIASALAEIRRTHARPPARKEAITQADIRAMIATLPYDLRGLRDRAILLLGYAGALRRSEIVSLDLHRGDTPDSRGWVELPTTGSAWVTLNTRTGPRDIAIRRGPSDRFCPVHALEQWLHYARIQSGPIFLATSRDGTRVLDRRLNDKHVARLIKRTVLDAGLRPDLPERDRLALFSGQSLRSGPPSAGPT